MKLARDLHYFVNFAECNEFLTDPIMLRVLQEIKLRFSYTCDLTFFPFSLLDLITEKSSG